MNEPVLYCAGKTDAIAYAARYLKAAGVTIVPEPGTTTNHVLLDIPSFTSDGTLRCGGRWEDLLAELPQHILVFGGNSPPLGQTAFVDLLKDPLYLAQNAYITAECALQIALEQLNRTIRDCPVLIIGWGRIGKCLAMLFRQLGANVTIAARKKVDRALCQAMGFDAGDIPFLLPQLDRFRLIVNTVPSPVLTREQLAMCRTDCVKIELASQNGLEGDNIVIARGLPGIHMPESSGQLIARTYLRLSKEENP